jgi:hypothetical protein
MKRMKDSLKLVEEIKQKVKRKIQRRKYLNRRKQI